METQADDPQLLAFLAGADRPCPGCGYNLRDQRHARCPECGLEIELVLAAKDPPQRSWIALVAPWLLGSGVGIWFICYSIRWRTALLFKVIQTVEIYVACVPFALITLLLRKRFLQLNALIRWMAVAISWLLVAAAFAWGVHVIR